MTRRPLHRSALLALALLLGLGAATGLAACGGDDGPDADDISKTELEQRLLASGMPEGTAACVADTAFEQLEQDEINTVVRTPSNEAAGKELVDAYSKIVGDCTTAAVQDGLEDRGVTTTTGDGTETTAPTSAAD